MWSVLCYLVQKVHRCLFKVVWYHIPVFQVCEVSMCHVATGVSFAIEKIRKEFTSPSVDGFMFWGMLCRGPGGMAIILMNEYDTNWLVTLLMVGLRRTYSNAGSSDLVARMVRFPRASSKPATSVE